MAKNYFLNQAKSFTSESYVSQLHGNANKKTRKWRSNEKKNAGIEQGHDWNKICWKKVKNE